MGGVEYHRRLRCALENRQCAHVGHERVVTERYAPLRHQNIAIAGAGDFLNNILHVPWRQKLAFLHVDDFSGSSRRR